MKPRLWFILICVIGLMACTSRQAYQAPKQTDDGWQTATPAAVGLDESKLHEAVKQVQNKTYQNVDSLLIVKDGKLVFEVYFDGHEWDYDSPQFRGKLVRYGPETRHNLASVTKSVTSILVGIALDQGKIQSVGDKVFTYFPQYEHLSDARKATITLEHLLTMSSGLQWNEGELPYSNPNNDLVRLFSEPDPIEYILSRPLVSEPGARFYYGGDNTNLLGEAIRSATGQRMDAFAEEVLFGPLGITDYAWDFINPDMIHASGNLQLCPRDMAKLGQLCLNDGVWEGQRIVSEAWISESTQKHVTHSATSGYGYQWWLKTYNLGIASVDTFYAAGWGGQKIIVAPALDMVIVFTGGNYASEDPSEEILTRYILPAVREHKSTPTPISSSESTTIPSPKVASQDTKIEETETVQAEITGLVDVGGHKLFIHCTGAGTPTVILEAGWGDTSDTWALVQPEIAQVTRVCAYDRAGEGKSESGPEPRANLRIANELHTLLENNAIQGPYILVGHSWGGVYARVYADRYQEDVVGLVLVDSSHPDQFRRNLAVLPPASPDDSDSLKF